MELNEFLHGFGARGAARVMALQDAGQGLLGQQASFFFSQHGHLRVELQFVEVRPHQLQAETVECSDVGRVKQRQLLVPLESIGGSIQLLLKPGSDALAHFGGRSLGKCHHQDLIEGGRGTLREQTVQAALHQRPGLARSGPGDHQHIAARRDSLFLGGRQAHKLAGRDWDSGSSPATEKLGKR